MSPATRLAGSTVALLPSVNLLPPEIAERAAFRKVQIGLGAAVLASLGVVGLLYNSASGSVSDAQASLDSVVAQHSSLQRQAAKYRNVTAVYAKAAAAQASLTSAMGDEVRYSQMLNDLSLTIPSNVWLKNVSFVATTATAATAAGGKPGIGTLTATAVAFSHDDVAVWLESIAGLKTYSNPYFSSSTEALIGTRKVVNFTSTATVTPAALSGRFTKPIGG